MDAVPIIRLEHFTETQVSAFRIADNRLTDISFWDDKILAETLKELSELELAFNLEATGFTMGEIDLLIEALLQRVIPGMTRRTDLQHRPVCRPSPSSVISGGQDDTPYCAVTRSWMAGWILSRVAPLKLRAGRLYRFSVQRENCWPCIRQRSHQASRFRDGRGRTR